MCLPPRPGWCGACATAWRISPRAAQAPPILPGANAETGCASITAAAGYSQYCRMKQGSAAVMVGQRVATGTRLGQLGMSGKAEFPHLHSALRQAGRIVDPFLPHGAPNCTKASPTARKPPPQASGSRRFPAARAASRAPVPRPARLPVRRCLPAARPPRKTRRAWCAFTAGGPAIAGAGPRGIAAGLSASCAAEKRSAPQKFRFGSLPEQITPGIHRSVNLSSIRRFCARASGVLAGLTGWYSPKPVAARRSGGMPNSSIM